LWTIIKTYKEMKKELAVYITGNGSKMEVIHALEKNH